MTGESGTLDVVGLIIILSKSTHCYSNYYVKILVFYVAVAGVGVWAGWKNRHKGKGDNGYIVGDR